MIVSVNQSELNVLTVGGIRRFFIIPYGEQKDRTCENITVPRVDMVGYKSSYHKCAESFPPSSIPTEGNILKLPDISFVHKLQKCQI